MQKAYDYVIVGAGSAGCVLAAKLSENADSTVLLLEAGGTDWDPLISIPIGMGLLHRHQLHDWAYVSEPEPFLDNRRIQLAAGKVLGGSSSINVMAYTRGNPGDYDRWAANGATGWSYKETLPYFKACETFEGGASEARGGSGPLGTQFAKTKDPIFPAWMEAGQQAGFPITDDYNGGQQEGFGRGQYTIRDGRRCSAARAFLNPARGRPNLTIVTGAQALELTFDGQRASGIRVSIKGQVEVVEARREIVISSGAYQSPRLLMLSGIGPADDLKALGITPRVDLPVGHDLQDHIGAWINWTRKSPGTFHSAMRLDRMAVSMVQAYVSGEGPATVVPGGLHAFVKTKPDIPVPDIEFLFHTVPPDTRTWLPGLRPAYDDGYAIRPVLLHPKSRGRVSLASADPRDPPRIQYNFLSHPDDLPVLREGFKRARDVGEQAAMDPYRDVESNPGKDVRTDAEIDAFLRRTISTVHHPSSTCRMGSDETSVLDTQMRVRGVDGLRVCDASAFPDLISGHLNAGVIMMAAKTADMMKGNG